MAMIFKNTYRAVLALCLLHLIAGDLRAQPSPFDPELSDQAALIREELSGFTDRSLYITGEAIKFTMRVQTSGLPEARDWSRILYLDLISASGVRQAQGKFRIRDRMASGELEIPEGLLTGVYYLRAYTRWMRNRDPSGYAYLPLRIINPFSSELDEGIPAEEGIQVLSPLAINEDVVEISAGSLSYGREDSVHAELLHFAGGASERVHGCLSIVPAAVKPGTALQAEKRDGQEGSFELNFLPDLYGVTLSGRVFSGEEEQIPVGSKVHITLLGDQSGYAVARTDARGRFSLSLPNREGRLELFVQPEEAGGQSMEVRIDQDFDSRVLPLDHPSFRLDPEEIPVITQMARKLQLSRLYGEAPEGRKQEEDQIPLPIYGTPDFRLILDDYVLLPTLEEVFINLVFDVTPVSRRGRTDLHISSVNPAVSMFPPLLMIDQVPLFNIEQFMSISPAKLSHIDVITDVYLHGDLRFGGVINLWSLEGNMAGIDLPEHSFFIDYQALNPSPDKPAEGYSSANHLPDTRNTILWMPELQLEKSVSRSLSFPAPDYPGDYVIIFQGWDEQGNTISAETHIIVE